MHQHALPRSTSDSITSRARSFSSAFFDLKLSLLLWLLADLRLFFTFLIMNTPSEHLFFQLINLREHFFDALDCPRLLSFIYPKFDIMNRYFPLFLIKLQQQIFKRCRLLIAVLPS